MLTKEELKEIALGWKSGINELITSDNTIHDLMEREQVRKDYAELFDALDETIDRCFADMSKGEADMSNIIIAGVSYLSFSANPIDINLNDYYTAGGAISEETVYGLDSEWFYEGRITNPENCKLFKYCQDIENGIEKDSKDRENLIARLKGSTMFDSFRCIFEGESPAGIAGDMKAIGTKIFTDWNAAEIIATYNYHVYIPSYIGVHP